MKQSLVGGLFVWTGVCAAVAAAGGLRQDENDASPRALSGLSVSHAYEVEDNAPWNPGDDLLVRLLYRIGKVSPRSLANYRDRAAALDRETMEGDPRNHRFWVVRVAGTVASVRPSPLGAAATEELKGYFEIDLETEEGPVRLISRRLPDSWQRGDPQGQRVAATGFFFRLLPTDTVAAPQSAEPLEEGEREPVVIVNQLQWFPQSPAPDLGIGPSQALLGAAGIDVAGWDAVRRLNRLPLKEADGPVFYSLLELADQLDSGRLPGQRVDFLSLLASPQSHFGDAVAFRARVARCVPIAIEPGGAAELTGRQEYYELDLFYLLDPGQLIMVDELEYRDRFPVTVCVPRLPEGFTPAELAGRTVQIEGFFYRFWQYPSEFTGAGAGQLCPLVIGLVPRVVTTSPGFLNRFLGVALLAILALIGGVTWYAVREGARDRQPRGAGRLPAQIDWPAAEDAAHGDDRPGSRPPV